MLRHIALNTFAGWLAGTMCSLGGALKDSPLEGFKRSTFPRSMVVATFWGFVSSAVTADFFLAFAFAGYFERMSVEGWKIMRAKRPSKFVAPGWVSEWGNIQPARSHESPDGQVGLIRQDARRSPNSQRP
jgi:hypothetical protein